MVSPNDSLSAALGADPKGVWYANHAHDLLRQLRRLPMFYWVGGVLFRELPVRFFWQVKETGGVTTHRLWVDVPDGVVRHIQQQHVQDAARTLGLLSGVLEQPVRPGDERDEQRLPVGIEGMKIITERDDLLTTLSTATQVSDPRLIPSIGCWKGDPNAHAYLRPAGTHVVVDLTGVTRDSTRLWQEAFRNFIGQD
jgi:hypothetical protein